MKLERHPEAGKYIFRNKINEVKKPTDFPFKDLKGFTDIIGFDVVLEDIHNLNLFNNENEKIEYCNNLYFYLYLIYHNWEEFHQVADWVPYEIYKNNLDVKYGSIFFTHFLKLFKEYEMFPWEKESEMKFYKESLSSLLTSFLDELLKGLKKGIFIFNYAYDSIESYINDIDEVEKSEFFIECFYFLEKNYAGKYDPLKFLNLVNETLNLVYDPALPYPFRVLNAILFQRQEATEAENEVETKALLYCVLLGIKYRIGAPPLISYLPQNKFVNITESFNKELDLHYKFLNGKAKILNCTLDSYPDPPQLTVQPYEVIWPEKEEVEDLISNSFENYLTPEFKSSLPVLKNLYKEGLKNRLVYMLFALKDLGGLTLDFTSNQTKYYQALKESFEKVGSYGNFNIHIGKFNSANEEEQQEIHNHVLRIKNAIENNKKLELN